MKGKPIEDWKPKNRVELETYRKRLVEIITANSVSSFFFRIKIDEYINEHLIEIHQLWLGD